MKMHSGMGTDSAPSFGVSVLSYIPKWAVTILGLFSYRAHETNMIHQSRAQLALSRIS